MSRTAWPWPDIITTIARRSRTGSLALRVIFWILRPSSIDSGRTNTLGLRANIYLPHSRAGSVTSAADEINYLVDPACRATDMEAALSSGHGEAVSATVAVDTASVAGSRSWWRACR